MILSPDTVKRFEIELAVDTPSHRGTLVTRGDISYNVGDPISVSWGNFSLSGRIRSKRQRWVGMKSTENAYENEYEIAVEHPELYGSVKFAQVFSSLSDLFGYIPLTVHDQTTRLVTDVYVHFEGTIMELIAFYADMVGGCYFIGDNAVWFFPLTATALSMPSSALNAYLETGYMGAGVSGVVYTETVDTTRQATIHIDLKRENTIVSVESPQKWYFDEATWYWLAGVIAETVVSLPYEVVSVDSVSPSGYTGLYGITDIVEMYRREWEYSVEGDKLIIRVREVLEPNIESKQMNNELREALLSDLASRESPHFIATISYKAKENQTVTVGISPYLHIDVSHVPAKTRQYYAEKMLFYNSLRHRLVVAKEYGPADTLPAVGGVPLVSRVHYSYDPVGDLMIVTREVIG